MNQVSLKGMLELTAACGFLFTIAPARSMVLYGFCFAVLAIWSLRASRWAVRWLLVNWMGAWSAIFLGLACLEHTLAGEAAYQAIDHWVFAGLGLIVWGCLAAANGIPFLAESLSWDPIDRDEPRERRRVGI
jgi:hypothetical protein